MQIKRLQAMCEDYMMKNIELENVCDLFSLADRVHASQLKTFCMNWIVSNWSEVFKRGTFYSFHSFILIDLFIYMDYILSFVV